MSLHENITPTKGFWMDEDTPWQPVAEGLSRQVMGYDGKIMLVKAKFETGAAVSYTLFRVRASPR